MVIRGDGSVRGDEAVAGLREGVARLRCCWSSGRRESGREAVQVNGLR